MEAFDSFFPLLFTALCLVSLTTRQRENDNTRTNRARDFFFPLSRTMRIVRRIVRSHAEEKTSIINRSPALYRLFVGRSRGSKSPWKNLHRTYIYTHTHEIDFFGKSVDRRLIGDRAVWLTFPCRVKNGETAGVTEFWLKATEERARQGTIVCTFSLNFRIAARLHRPCYVLSNDGSTKYSLFFSWIF